MMSATPVESVACGCGAESRLTRLDERFTSPWREALDRAISGAINPDEHQCGPTDFDVWIGGELAEIQDFDAFNSIAELGALDWATFNSLKFDNDASDDYIGANGEDTHAVNQQLTDLKRFWDIPSADIQLQGMHGADLKDDASMQPVVQFLLGVDAEQATGIIDYVQGVIEADPGLGYGNPLWTLNAFALSSRGEPEGSPFAGLPDKIVMGDGISEALAGMGLARNGPKFVLAHEFGHHVQYELGEFDDYSSVPPEELPEFTRRTELMADSFGAYFMAHPKGGALGSKATQDVFRSAYVVGDCAFDNAGHHGTPNQREAAAKWGADLAASARPKGMVNSSPLMLQLFNAKLPDLIAPDVLEGGADGLHELLGSKHR